MKWQTLPLLVTGRVGLGGGTGWENVESQAHHAHHCHSHLAARHIPVTRRDPQGLKWNKRPPYFLFYTTCSHPRPSSTSPSVSSFKTPRLLPGSLFSPMSSETPVWIITNLTLIECFCKNEANSVFFKKERELWFIKMPEGCFILQACATRLFYFTILMVPLSSVTCSKFYTFFKIFNNLT